MKYTLLPSIIMVSIIGCQNSMDSPETLQKLRAIGVKTTPHILTPENSNSSVNYTFYFAKPVGSPDLTVDNYNDPQSFVPYIPIDASSAVVSSENFGGMDLLEVTLSGGLSDLALLPIRPDIGFTTLPFGLTVSSGSEIENVVGRQVIVPVGEAAKYTIPEFTLSEPTSRTLSSATTPLSASLETVSEETYRISWYVSSGSVKNPKALVTVWKDIAVGENLLIFTARGRKTNAFFIKALKITR